jgi:hypothetical protein
VTVFGVGLHAQSGFSTVVKETIQMPSRKGHYFFCGSDAAPTGSSRLFTGLSS